MNLHALFRRGLSFLLGLLLTLELAACGTLIYPERRGQTRGNIDPLVAILDGVGLIFFIVPGMIAFAIDFNTGAIYLPRGGRSQDRLDQLRKKIDSRLDPAADDIRVVRLDPAQLTPEMVAEILRSQAGVEVDLHHPDLAAYRLENPEEIRAGLIRLDAIAAAPSAGG